MDIDVTSFLSVLQNNMNLHNVNGLQTKQYLKRVAVRALIDCRVVRQKTFIGLPISTRVE